jgi:lycopene cyclase domain-containing protein
MTEALGLSNTRSSRLARTAGRASSNLGLYLAALVVSLLGLVGLDRRHKLVFFRDWVAGAVSITVGVVFFLIWDLFGIANGIFFRGETVGLTGLLLAPELPIEEVLFLTLLCYTTLEVFLGLGRFVHSRRDRKAEAKK